jgi:hypothetical protein
VIHPRMIHPGIMQISLSVCGFATFAFRTPLKFLQT